MIAPCAHDRTSQSPGSPYQYCHDCGAVRVQLSGKPGQFEAWHSCALCRLPVNEPAQRIEGEP